MFRLSRERFPFLCQHFFLNRGVSEESFLKTPFFNGRECSKPEMGYKFKDVFSPGIANSEVVDLKQLPNLQLGDYYTQIKVSFEDRFKKIISGNAFVYCCSSEVYLPIWLHFKYLFLS